MRPLNTLGFLLLEILFVWICFVFFALVYFHVYLRVTLIYVGIHVISYINRSYVYQIGFPDLWRMEILWNKLIAWWDWSPKNHLKLLTRWNSDQNNIEKQPYRSLASRILYSLLSLQFGAVSTSHALIWLDKQHETGSYIETPLIYSPVLNIGRVGRDIIR